MYRIKDLKVAVQRAKAQGDVSLTLNESSLQLYNGEPLQFNVTLAGRRFPTIKFEERPRDKFTVAVAPEDGASIDYTQAKVFTMDEPLERIAVAFPRSTDIRQFVDCLVNSK